MVSATSLEELYEPLSKIQLPTTQQLENLISEHGAWSLEQTKTEFTLISQSILQWLETAHMIAFSIEQNIKRGDSITFQQEREYNDNTVIGPLQSSCNTHMIPLIHQLTEVVEDVDILQDDMQAKMTTTKIQSEWSGLQHFISSVMALMEQAQEKQFFQHLMESILLQIDDLSLMIFQFQERRSQQQQKQTADSELDDNAANRKEDGILVEIDNQVGPLFSNVEKVYSRMTSSTPPEDSSDLLARKHILVQERWESLRVEIEELKIELKEDRWLIVFKQVADQVDEMMNGLDRVVTQCYTTLQQIRDYSPLSTSSSTTSTSSITNNNIGALSSNHNNAAPVSAADLKSMLRRDEKHFEAKYKHYTPSIAKMLLMLGNGIAARVSRNTSTLQRHESMLARWNQLKITMDHLRRQDLPDIMMDSSSSLLLDPSSDMLARGRWSRMSDRSDNSSTTTTSVSTTTGTRFNSKYMEIMDDFGPGGNSNRSKSPFTKTNSLLLSMEENNQKSRRETSSSNSSNLLWRPMTASPTNGGRRTASPFNKSNGAASDSNNNVSLYVNGSGPNSTSPSNSSNIQRHYLYHQSSPTTASTATAHRMVEGEYLPEEDDGDDFISTQDFRQQQQQRPSSCLPPSFQQQQQTNRSRSSLAITRSVTPSNNTKFTRRANTPSMIPRPKTPTASTAANSSNLKKPSKSSFVSSFSLPYSTSNNYPDKYKPDMKDPLDREIAEIVNRSPITIHCSKSNKVVAGVGEGGSIGGGRYYFGNELNPSLGGGKKMYTCKLMVYEKNAKRNKVLVRVGGGWQDLEIFLLEHMNLIG